MTQPIAAVLFDLDGTLVDSAPGIHQALDAALQDHTGIPCAMADVRQWVGNGPRKLVERALRSQRVDPAQVTPVLAAFGKHYADTVFNGALYPGVAEGLPLLTAAGLRLACITNKPWPFTEPYLAHLGIARHFSTVICADQVNRPKPDPESLALACRRLEVSVANAVMVGDSANDLQPANALGMRCVAVGYGYDQNAPLSDYGPEFIASAFEDVVHYLLSQARS